MQHKRTRYSRKQVFASSHTPIAASRHVLDSDIEAHSHDFVEVALIFGGSGIHSTVHGHHPIRAGDAFIFRPGAWHAYYECHQLDVYNCCFGLEILQRELAWTREDGLLNWLFWTGPLSLNRRGILTVTIPPTMLQAYQVQLDALCNARTDSASGSSRISQIAQLLLFFGLLTQSLEQSQGSYRGQMAHMHQAVLRGIQLLENNLAHPWSLPELAEQLHLDRSYLVRLFRAATGLSPIAYLARQRAERAAALLVRTTLPINQIGEAIGWPDPNYFARRFKAHFGVNATIYRGQLQQSGLHMPMNSQSNENGRLQADFAAY
jgi:AraC family L-rhamnose operon transcriptional activator RhaR